MTMSDVQTFILTVISSASASVALSGAVVWLAKNWLTERLRASIKHEYDQRLAILNAELKAQSDVRATALKAQIDREAERLRFVSSSYSDVQKAVISRKLDAIDSIWQGALAVRQVTPAILTFFDILTVDEYISAKDNPTFRQLRGELNQEKITKTVQDVKGSLERNRPYVGEYTWAVFSTYQTIILRIVLLVHFSTQDADKLNWHRDRMVQQLLRSALSTVEVTELESTEFGKIEWIKRKFEHRLLTAIDQVLSGEALSEAALSQARKMEEQVIQASKAQAGQVDPA